MDTLTGHWSMFKNSIYIQIFQQKGENIFIVYNAVQM